jgi:hypothetical protein
MKTKSFLLIAVLLLSIAMSFSANADVVLNSTNFPDAKFRAYVAKLTSVTEGGNISNSKIADVTSINCSSNSIADLTGIEYFTALTYLNCSSNKLTTLNINKCTLLQDLRCYTNSLTSLDCHGLTSLRNISCYSNKLTSINVNNCTALSTFYCYTNSLTSIDVSTCTNLGIFRPYENQLTSLDLSSNHALSDIDCHSCKLTSLTLPSYTSQTSLQINCYSNNITSLNLYSLPVSWLYAQSNNLNAINLSQDANTQCAFAAGSNGRNIKAYSYSYDDVTGYYVPLEDQYMTDIKGNYITDSNGNKIIAAKKLATLIDEAGEGSSEFDISRVVTGSWNGATLNTIKGTPVLILDASKKKFTYNYNTGFPGTPFSWYVDNSATYPNANFYITWSSDDVLTAVDGVESNDIDVYTTAGMINVGGSFNGKVNVYNLRGQQVYCGNSSEIAVPAGMYVVKVDGTVHKVLVK